MIDPQILRKQPELLQRALELRGHQFDWDKYQVLEAQRKQLQGRSEQLQATRNQGAKDIARARGHSDTAALDALMQQMEASKAESAQAQQELAVVKAELESLLLGVANIPAADVPAGADDSANVTLRSWGEPRSFDFEPKPHDELFANSQLLDFDFASSLAGSRFVSLHGAVARLHRALAQFMLDTHTSEHGYRECYVPYMVKADILRGTGQLPKFADDLFCTQEQLYLIPTSEVPLTNFARARIFRPEELPIKLVAHTPCFRQEAGSYGRDTKGMLRQHQFEKVELVQIVEPSQSWQTLESMVGHAERVLQALGLSYRAVRLCVGDLGFASATTIDLEVWLPSQSCYREISSISNCTDFQARRMQARWRPNGKAKPELLHTLNGSGVAVGRALLAILENYQRQDGAVVVPEALRPYMGGIEVIEDSH